MITSAIAVQKERALAGGDQQGDFWRSDILGMTHGGSPIRKVGGKSTAMLDGLNGRMKMEPINW
jgi:hypothetical protein